jgi:hypothetical protein
MLHYRYSASREYPNNVVVSTLADEARGKFFGFWILDLMRATRERR